MLSRLLHLLRRHRRPVVLAVLLLVLTGLLSLAMLASSEAKKRQTETSKSFTESAEDWLAHPVDLAVFQKELAAGMLRSVALANSIEPTDRKVMLLYTLKDGRKLSTVVPGCSSTICENSTVAALAAKSAELGFTLVRVDIDWRSPSEIILGLVASVLGLVVTFGLMGFVIYLVMKMQGNMEGGKAEVLTEPPSIRFDDVVGAKEAKAAFQRVQAFMRDPQQYVKLGAHAPRGVMLEGPPGTGKTLLAKALAGECKASFIAVDGSYFTSMFYGAGVAKVRKLFETARRNAPCILFIDEIDGLGQRSQGEMRGGEAELNRIINRVLVEMDGFGAEDGVVVVAATNHAQNIDPALRRPGRFDMLISLALPTLFEREELFQLYGRKVPNDGSWDHRSMARMTPNMSPADIANIVNKAASRAAEHGASSVSQEHVIAAIETQQMGGEVSPVKALLTDDTRRRIAYHEAGHALVAHILRSGTVERVSIEPRGGALGVTYVSRDTEEPLYAQGELASRLAMMLAGREAELMTFGDVSSGASDDLKRATELAINMVTNLGFSETFGLLSVAGVPKELLGPDTQAAALTEARRLLEVAQEQCRDVCDLHLDRLVALANALLQDETVGGDRLKTLLGGVDEAVRPALSLQRIVRAVDIELELEPTAA